MPKKCRKWVLLFAVVRIRFSSNAGSFSNRLSNYFACVWEAPSSWLCLNPFLFPFCHRYTSQFPGKCCREVVQFGSETSPRSRKSVPWWPKVSLRKLLPSPGVIYVLFLEVFSVFLNSRFVVGLDVIFVLVAIDFVIFHFRPLFFHIGRFLISVAVVR